MGTASLDQEDDLHDFSRQSLEFAGITKNTYIQGSGPAVIVMTEMPGISPQVARFARWIGAAGFTVYMPSLFGQDGKVASAEEGAAVFQKTCVSAEFRALGVNEPRPITGWLRALARHAHDQCGGVGVGAIGMCFTGNFALTMMLEPVMLAPVLSQPSLPLDAPSALDSSSEELQQIRHRLEQEDLTVLAYRFQGDPICRAERFAAYAEALGTRFQARELPDSAANQDVSPFFKRHVPFPHSVVTQHLVDTAGHPTLAARDEIIAFFKKRLMP